MSTQVPTILVIRQFGSDTVRLVQKYNAHTVIYLKQASAGTPSLLPGATNIIYAYDDLRKVIAYSFDQVKAGLSKIRRSVPGLFVYRNYDIAHGLEKDVFWATLDRFAVEYQLGKLGFKDPAVINLTARNSFIGNLALWKLLFIDGGRFYRFDLPGKISSEMIGFRINNPGAVALLGDLPRALPKERNLSFQTVPQSGNKSVVTENNVFSSNITAKKARFPRRRMRLAARFKLCYCLVDADLKNVVARCAFELYNHIEQYDRLLSAGLRKVFLLAAENEGEGNIADLVSRKLGALTFNYANGAKNGDPQNINTHFSYWFMPDIGTQKIFLKYGQMSVDQLPVTGHLMEDQALNHRYSGTLDYLNETIENRKVISLFTSVFFIKERDDVLEFLAGFLSQYPDVIVLVRRHPRDRASFPTGHARIIMLGEPSSENRDLSLLDLLSRSHAAISFSSTTSLQASWFGIPSINFEYKSASGLPFVDNVRVFHAGSIEALKDLLVEQLIRGREIVAGVDQVRASAVIGGYLLNT